MKLDDIRKLCDEATPGPWKYDWGNWAVERDCIGLPEHRSDVCSTTGLDRYIKSKDEFGEDDRMEVFNQAGNPYDGEFIAASRTLLPKLLAIVEELKGSCASDIVGDDVVRMIAALESDP